MAAGRAELLASAAQSASGSGAWIPITTWTMLNVVAAISAASGTITDFDLWLEGASDANGSNPHQIPCDIQYKNGAAAGTEATVNTNKIHIINSKADTTAPEVYTAQYKHLPCNYVRARWYMAGTTPSVTFSVMALGK